MKERTKKAITWAAVIGCFAAIAAVSFATSSHTKEKKYPLEWAKEEILSKYDECAYEWQRVEYDFEYDPSRIGVMYDFKVFDLSEETRGNVDCWFVWVEGPKKQDAMLTEEEALICSWKYASYEVGQ